MLSKCFQQNFLVKKQIIFLQLEQVRRERHSELQSMSIIVACETARTNYTIYNQKKYIPRPIFLRKILLSYTGSKMAVYSRSIYQQFQCTKFDLSFRSRFHSVCTNKMIYNGRCLLSHYPR